MQGKTDRSSSGFIVSPTNGLLILFLLACLVLPLSPLSAQENEVNLTYSTMDPEGAGFNTTYATEILPEIMEEVTPGTFSFEYRGGPESIPPPELFSFVQRGALDFTSIPVMLYAGEIFEAIAINIVEMPPWELRQTGVHEWMDDLHRPHGIKYLGRTMSGMRNHCYTSERPESPEDLAGVPLWGSETTRGFLEHFGAEVVHMPLPELYTALERGVIEGLCLPEPTQLLETESYEHVNYILKPEFYHLEVSLIMNLETWQNLTSEQQDKLKRGIRKMERRQHEYMVEQEDQLFERMKEEGMEVVEFEGEDARRWEEASEREFWRHLFENSDRRDKLRDLYRMMEQAGYETTFPEEFKE